MISVSNIHLEPGRMTVLVACSKGNEETNEELAWKVTQAFPNLPYHACINSEGPSFGAVITHTSLPHLLEHLIIDLQVAAEPPESTYTFTGCTEWINKTEGLAKVSVSFRDDTVVLRALNEACTYLNSVL